MSVAAIVALAHDIVITIGVYALSGFEVTPATVTGLLTILGFSLYDTVVVFDKVRENTKNLRAAAARRTPRRPTSRSTRPWSARSTPRSWRCIPVGASSTSAPSSSAPAPLKDLALALFVGMAAGVFSSIFIATPLLVQLKSSEAGDPAQRTSGPRPARRHEADRYASVPVFTDDMPIKADLDRAAVASAATAAPSGGGDAPGAPGRAGRRGAPVAAGVAPAISGPGQGEQPSAGASAADAGSRGPSGTE